MRIYIMDALRISIPGRFELIRLTRDEFVSRVRAVANRRELVSAVWSPRVAEEIRWIACVPIYPREICIDPEPGDEILLAIPQTRATLRLAFALVRFLREESDE